MHVGGIVAPALGPIARRVRLLKSEGTKKENEREFKKKCPRPTWNKFFFTTRIELWLAAHR